MMVAEWLNGMVKELERTFIFYPCLLQQAQQQWETNDISQ